MICLHYRDDEERARAVVSVVERCRRLDARLVFLGSEAACRATQEATSSLLTRAQPRLAFKPLSSWSDWPNLDRECDEALEVMRAALLEALSGGGEVVAWVEAPLARSGVATVEALLAFHRTLDGTSSASDATVISAVRLDRVAENALFGLLSLNTLIDAKVILPRCPFWLVNRARTDLTPVAGIPLPSDLLDNTDGPFTSQTEKLAALGQLVAGIAHELGNPLSIISSSLQYLHQRLASADDPASDFTMAALQGVERMHGLLRSMLNFATVKEPRVEQIDLKEVISEILRFTSAECMKRGIAVNVSFDPSLPRIWLDSCGVKQILLNLLKNALDALAQGGDTLRVRTRIGPEVRMAMVDIENNGPAIPFEVLPDLFRPFHTTKDDGTGLGLYLSRQMAKSHGGDLEAENLPDGVRFTLMLPLDRWMGEYHGACSDRR